MMYEVEYRPYANNERFNTTWADEFVDLRDGFWVNPRGQFTKGSDAYQFILPHQINYILKVVDPDEL